MGSRLEDDGSLEDPAVSLLGNQKVSSRPRISFTAGSERLGTCVRSHSEVGRSAWVLWASWERGCVSETSFEQRGRLSSHPYRLTSRTLWLSHFCGYSFCPHHSFPVCAVRFISPLSLHSVSALQSSMAHYCPLAED